MNCDLIKVCNKKVKKLKGSFLWGFFAKYNKQLKVVY